MELKDKRLLVIGATSMMATAVETAKKHGIYTVVVDYFEDSPAKKIADKAYLVSTADTEMLLEICKNEKIDGVYSNYSEVNQFFTLDLTERGGYYNYATREQANILANKANFKAACRKYGVGVVPEFELDENCKQQDLAQIEYPAIVKPVDSFSGKGITICQNEEELREAIPVALGVSKSRKFLVEKYMSDEDYDVIAVYYSIQDGKVALSSMVDRYMVDFENKRRLNTALVYPSQYLGRFLNEMDAPIRNMLEGLGVQNGSIFMEGAVNDSGFYLWEAGYRLCGAQQNIFPAHINHLDMQEMLICHALTGKMADENLMHLEDPWFKGKVACNGLIFVRPGKVCDVKGIEQVLGMPGVINFTQLMHAGDVVNEGDIGTLNQSFARFHIVADNKDELFALITSIMNTISVEDENGENMTINTFDFDLMRCDKRWANQ